MEGRNIMYIVDDEEGIRNSLDRELRRWCRERGLAAVQFAKPEAALQALEHEHDRVRIIISDQRMPGMDGSVFLSAVAERYPEIATLLLTGNIDIKQLQEASHPRVLGVIGKPWDHELLLEELGRAYGAGTAAAAG